MIASGYSMHLYCEYQEDKTVRHNLYNFESGSSLIVDGQPIIYQFFGESFTGCARDARAEGWKISKKHQLAVCPVCAKMGRLLGKGK